MDNIKTGLQISLNNTDLYSIPGAIKSAGKKSGIFYIWDDNIKNNMIRITSSKINIGKPGCITGWVKISQIDINNTI